MKDGRCKESSQGKGRSEVGGRKRKGRRKEISGKKEKRRRKEG